MRRLGSTLTVLVLTIGFLQGCDKRTEPVAGPPWHHRYRSSIRRCWGRRATCS